MARVFLTGSLGQVGSELELALLKRGHHVVSAPHQHLDITQQDRVMSAILDSHADAVINAAAFTNVERCEDEAPFAYAVNALGARNVALACKAANIPLLHISTDYVFSDDKHCEHMETDDPQVQCIYGKTKLEGENLILNTGCKAIIVRTSWVFGRFGRNFVKIMLSMAQQRDEIAVVCDQVGNPTPARALAEAMVLMTEQSLAPDFYDYGIYHYCGCRATSWDEFARAIFHIAKQMQVMTKDIDVISIGSDEFKSKVHRPRDSRLACLKVESVFGLTQPFWPDYLQEVITSYVRESKGLSPVENYPATE